jgi:hypothetical protein
MALHNPFRNQHRLPYASLSRTLTLSTPYSRYAKIASYTLHLRFTPALIKSMPEIAKSKLKEVKQTSAGAPNEIHRRALSFTSDLFLVNTFHKPANFITLVRDHLF